MISFFEKCFAPSPAWNRTPAEPEVCTPGSSPTGSASSASGSSLHPFYVRLRSESQKALGSNDLGRVKSTYNDVQNALVSGHSQEKTWVDDYRSSLNEYSTKLQARIKKLEAQPQARHSADLISLSPRKAAAAGSGLVRVPAEASAVLPSRQLDAFAHAVSQYRRQASLDQPSAARARPGLSRYSSMPARSSAAVLDASDSQERFSQSASPRFAALHAVPGSEN